MLDFDNRTLLYVSNLFNPNGFDDDGNRQASSPTVEKIKQIGLNTTSNNWQQSFLMFNNGFEINVLETSFENHAIDVPEDVEKILKLL